MSDNGAQIYELVAQTVSEKTVYVLDIATLLYFLIKFTGVTLVNKILQPSSVQFSDTSYVYCIVCLVLRSQISFHCLIFDNLYPLLPTTYWCSTMFHILNIIFHKFCFFNRTLTTKKQTVLL